MCECKFRSLININLYDIMRKYEIFILQKIYICCISFKMVLCSSVAVTAKHLKRLPFIMTKDK